MDYVAHFRREILAFEAAVRQAADADEAPLIPSCPGWSVSDLVVHLGGVHRFLHRLIGERLMTPPDAGDLSTFDLPADLADWPAPEQAPNRAPVAAQLTDWFAEGARALEEQFVRCGPNEPVWTFGPEQTTGFWPRMQSIEAALHRWDVENALGTAGPIDAELAVDAVTQTFEVMAPARRSWIPSPPGAGERFGFRQTDGPGRWSVHFDGADVRLTRTPDGPGDVELAGSASDLTLFLWQRIPADRLTVTGEQAVLDRYFALVPPI
ncbi:uncharacterized protein (TIGR03083 family) [Kitasatospora sp. MAA4]|uniref:maleylpyruvate isomerase family mycothiol-dependent enzyme n=1 Tax=Kitasatospora sp. MAA4 TaxID=3035093 RepID=UPI002475112C|nr:maleylpyruvate isomerase family mycothiol-dependent enzyme [Kitasatospora sp. MAA4]MDH6135736.1 uncharacterized protein (TIGR03083 family) [Kitasatospora sp. MAA4]